MTNSPTILHVDDSEANRYVVNRILQNAGFAVVEAATGAAGLKAIAEHQPILVILDVQLPDLNGFEVCRRIKSNPATAFLPVLHLSASFVHSRDKAEGLDSGADAYLAQPVEPIELLATVRALLRIRSAEEAALSSSREWQATFDAINDGVCLVDQQGIIQRCNQAMIQLVGSGSSEILGRAYDELLNAAWGFGDGHCLRRAKETCQRQVIEIQSQERWFAKTVDPVVNEQGTLTGAVLIVSDITARQRVEAERKQLLAREQAAREQAETANRIKDEFLAVLSHELRSPLNPILGWARILRAGQQDEARTQYALETIERNAKLQAQLIEDLLDVSRILQGKLNLNIAPISLPFTIKAALETVQLAAEAKTIQIRTNFDADVGQVLGDASRLQQVIWNLLTNAIKFTPPGGQVEICLEKTIRTEINPVDLATATPCEYAQITISDTGKGISLDFLPYVFEYFRQADSTTTRKFGGLGLGLAIVHHLVELHGGTVEAASPGEEQGATFTVKLPLIATATLDQTESTRHDRSNFNLRGLPILFVDDDRDSREVISFMLEQYGARVTKVDSASEALNQLNQAKFDLLISDIGMPDLDGYALVRQIRARSPEQGGKIPAIALTAYAGEIDQQQALAAGFQQHISKPLEPEVLIQIILTLAKRNGDYTKL